MSNPMINPQPNYSGVTIQITNPSVNAGGQNCLESTNQSCGYCSNSNSYYQNNVHNIANSNVPYLTRANAPMYNPQYVPEHNSQYPIQNVPYLTHSNVPIYNPQYAPAYNSEYPIQNLPYSAPANSDMRYNANGSYYSQQNVPNGVTTQNAPSASYPPQYYLNNYNYQNNGIENGDKIVKALNDLAQKDQVKDDNVLKQSGITPAEVENDYIKALNAKNASDYHIEQEEPQDFTKSQAVISDLDAREAAEKEAKKNSKEKRVVALTDEYIKSLENYLNNPNQEIRLMASKEILTRLDEDKDRFDDAALNALLNKMLQDPAKLIRVAALSAFASQLASGNDYTVHLLNNIQQSPNADKEDVLQAADILLKMSAGTEIKRIPNPQVKEDNQ